MRVNEILNESSSGYRPFYDEKTGHILGGNVKWLAALKASKEDVAAAIKQIKQSDSFRQALEAGLKFVATAGELKNGTLAFMQDAQQKNAEVTGNTGNYVYNIYVNGQIRQYPDIKHWLGVNPKTRITRLKSPKPKLIAGDTVKSIVATYSQAIDEIVKKYAKKKEVK